MAQPSSEQFRYRIGAVSRLTGIPAETLRVWERRYAVVAPQRTAGGSRLYSQREVAKLGLVKRLVDAGHAIGTVADLSLVELEDRAAQSRTLPGGPAGLKGGAVRMVLVGPTVAVRVEDELRRADAGSFSLAGAFTDVAGFEQAAPTLQADVLVAELPTLDSRSAGRVRGLQRLCGAARAVAVYSFGRAGHVRRLEEQGIAALRLPVCWEALRRAVGIDPVMTPNPAADPRSLFAGPVPPRRFDDRQLATAAAMSTRIDCECPHHLAELILALARFERYSAECELQGAEDAALHAWLHAATARSRAGLEAALERLLEIEGVDLDRRVTEAAGEAPAA